MPSPPAPSASAASANAVTSELSATKGGLTVERLVTLGRVQALAPSPCGEWLAVEVAALDHTGGAYRSDLWRVSVDSKGHEPVRLTRGPANNRAPAFRPDGGLAFLSNRAIEEGESSGKPKAQVWLLPKTGGEARPLTDEPLGVSSFQISTKGKRLVVMTSQWPDIALEKQRSHQEERDKSGPSALHYKDMPIRSWDHWVPETTSHFVAFDLEGQERVHLTPGCGRVFRGAEWDLSADGRYVVATSMGAVREDDRVYDQHLVVLDTASGAQRKLGEEDYAMLITPLWSPDGQRIACYRAARYPDKCVDHVLWLFDVATGEGRALAAEWDRWGSPAAWGPDGAVLYVTADNWGTKPVFAVDLEADAVTRITSPAAGGCHGSLHVLSGSGDIIGIRNTTLHPPEPFVINPVADATPKLLACLSGFSPEEGAAMVSVESFEVPAADGVPVQSFLIKPKRAEGAEETPLPLLFWIHGGPRSQWADGWHWRWNTLVGASQGYAVACPNPRGSTGCGREFIEGIWGNEWGGACYDDLMRVTDQLVARDDIDATKTVAMGGSFGGYMSNWIAANTDRFQTIVTHASLFALSQFFGHTDLPGWAALEMQCTPYSDPDAYDRYSPHRYIANWKTPTLVIHGARDFRVPITEALFLFESLQMHGVKSELLVFPDENHWILKPHNICTWYNTVFAFMSEHLAADTTST